MTKVDLGHNTLKTTSERVGSLNNNAVNPGQVRCAIVYLARVHVTEYCYIPFGSPWATRSSVY